MEYKPKQYTHIDYEAILIKAMKEQKSIEQCLQESGLQIARSTVIRNIRKIKESGKNLDIINLYENHYVPNMQKSELPESLMRKISDLKSRPIVRGNEMEELYKKLSIMKEIVDRCGSVAEATRQINSGNTALGNFKITHQGLCKNIKRYEIVKAKMEESKKEDKEAEVKE